MPVKYTGYITVKGNSFSPGRFESTVGHSFDDKSEPGSIGTVGRYRGVSIPYGFGTFYLRVDSGKSEINLDNSLVDLLAKWKLELLQLGATDVAIHFDVEYTGQCNLEFSPSFLQQLAILNFPLTITCFQSATLDGE